MWREWRLYPKLTCLPHSLSLWLANDTHALTEKGNRSLGGRNEANHPKETSELNFCFSLTKMRTNTSRSNSHRKKIDERPDPSQQTSVLLRVSGKSDLIIIVARTKCCKECPSISAPDLDLPS